MNAIQFLLYLPNSRISWEILRFSLVEYFPFLHLWKEMLLFFFLFLSQRDAVVKLPGGKVDAQLVDTILSANEEYGAILAPR